METENEQPIQKSFAALKAADQQKMEAFEAIWDRAVAVHRFRRRLRKFGFSLAAASAILAIFVGPGVISTRQNTLDFSIFYAEAPSDFLLEPTTGSIVQWESPTDFLLHSMELK